MAAPEELRGPEAAAVRLQEEEEEEEEEAPGDDSDRAELLGRPRPPRSFWTLEFYRAFFDVDTRQVLDRIRGSVTPLPGKNFVRQHLRDSPDLYGPFWICATLALTLTMGGSLAHLQEKRAAPSYRYGPQLHKATAAAAAVYGYAALVPLALWGVLRWRRGPGTPPGTPGLLETVCAYGYSLAAYVPAAVLWLIPAPWLQWLLLAVAALLSASVLALTFWPPLRAGGRAAALPVLGALVALHALLAVGCKLYFYPRPPAPSPVSPHATADALRSRALPPANASAGG